MGQAPSTSASAISTLSTTRTVSTIAASVGSTSAKATSSATVTAKASTTLVTSTSKPSSASSGAARTSTSVASSGTTSLSATLRTTSSLSLTGATSATSSTVASTATTGQLAVYFGQTPNTTKDGLLPLCQDPSISVVNLAFVNNFFSSGGYPSINLGNACWPPNPGSEADKAGASGLLNCTNIGSQIQTCQSTYKTKILLSLGGSVGSSSFPNMTAAKSFANQVWNLFGAANITSGLRPFGPGVVLDGFDIDNEDGNTQYWSDFVTQLRTNYNSVSSRKFYLGAAPQCPRPDASIPLSVLQQADYIWVQFYNNPSCNLDSGSGFLDSIANWSTDLKSTGGKVFIGAGAWSGAGQGYLAPNNLSSVVQQAKAAVSKAGNNYGGIMLWDGTVGAGNGYNLAAARAM